MYLPSSLQIHDRRFHNCTYMQPMEALIIRVTLTARRLNSAYQENSCWQTCFKRLLVLQNILLETVNYRIYIKFYGIILDQMQNALLISTVFHEFPDFTSFPFGKRISSYPCRSLNGIVAHFSIVPLLHSVTDMHLYNVSFGIINPFFKSFLEMPLITCYNT